MRSLHSHTACSYTIIFLKHSPSPLLLHSSFYHHGVFVPMEASFIYSWLRSLSLSSGIIFFFKPTEWAYNGVGIQKMSWTHERVCIDPSVRFNVTISHQRVHLTTVPQSFIEPTSHQWHCKQFLSPHPTAYTLSVVFPLRRGRFHWFHFCHLPFSPRPFLFLFNAMMRCIFSHVSIMILKYVHVTTWMLIIAATITVIHTVKCIPKLL